MAYDEALAGRIRRAVGRRLGVTERKMFGGLAFLFNGKMFCGIVGDELMVRVGPAGYEAALARPHARPMDFTGRPMNGYVYVGRVGCRTEKAVATWIERGATFVAQLDGEGTPRKAVRSKARPRARTRAR